MSRTNRDIQELSPLTQKKINMVLAEIGDIIFITEGYRSQSRQNELYAQGRTTKGSIVTYAKYSNHTARKAVDIGFRGPVLYPHGNDKRWKQVANVFKKHGFSRGGDWIKRKDRPHFEDNGNPLDANSLIMLFYEKLRTDHISSKPKKERALQDPHAFLERIKDLPIESKLSEMTFMVAVVMEKFNK